MVPAMILMTSIMTISDEGAGSWNSELVDGVQAGENTSNMSIIPDALSCRTYSFILGYTSRYIDKWIILDPENVQRPLASTTTTQTTQLKMPYFTAVLTKQDAPLGI